MTSARPLCFAGVTVAALAAVSCGGPTAPSSLASPRPVGVNDLRGSFTALIGAADVCSELPPSIRVRSYSAVIVSESSDHFVALLGGAAFQPEYDTFWGFVDNGRAFHFSLSSWYAYDRWLDDEPILEVLSPTEFVAIMGTAKVLIQSQDDISTTFEGTFTYCGAATPSPWPGIPPSCPQPIACQSDRHRLALLRQ